MLLSKTTSARDGSLAAVAVACVSRNERRTGWPRWLLSEKAPPLACARVNVGAAYRGSAAGAVGPRSTLSRAATSATPASRPAAIAPATARRPAGSTRLIQRLAEIRPGCAGVAPARLG